MCGGDVLREFTPVVQKKTTDDLIFHELTRSLCPVCQPGRCCAVGRVGDHRTGSRSERLCGARRPGVA
jgi:hypothetical protein